MTPTEGLAFVERHGVVLQAARGPVPSLAEAIAGGPIRGSWWGHPRGKEIFRVADAVSDSPDVLVCKLLDGKITYVHRRIWPALVKLAARFPKEGLAKVWNEHTASGAHRSRRIPFPEWVPDDVKQAASRLSAAQAEELLSPLTGQAVVEPGGPVPKDKDEAREEGFKRGMKGKKDAAGLTQGWTDDKASGVARSEGWVAGKRKRAQDEHVAERKKKTGK